MSCLGMQMVYLPGSTLYNMNTIQYALLPIFLLLSQPLSACINYYNVIPGISRESTDIYSIGEVRVNHAELMEYVIKKKKLCESLDTGCSDIVIGYLYLKNYKEALSLSKDLVKKYPREYNVVMTHAAALELNGFLAEAHRYISLGITLNPSSHRGSEWIHLKILEYSMKDHCAADSSLMGLDFGDGSVPEFKNSREVDNLLRQVHYQITDRLYFTGDKDPVMASLLYDYANLLYLSDYKTVSLDYFILASEYGYMNPAIVKRVMRVQDRIHAREMKRQEHDLNFNNDNYNKATAVRIFKDKYIYRQRTRIYILMGLVCLLGLGLAFAIALLIKKRKIQPE